jgi:hypothetical protein
MVISGLRKSTKASHPYNQGGRHLSMEAVHGDRVHSGCLPTLTVHKYNPYLGMLRSQSRKYEVQQGYVPSRVIREKVKGVYLRQLALFGV